MRYKYIVHDGTKVQDENYEWLGKTQGKGIVNRHLKIPGNCLVVCSLPFRYAIFYGSYNLQMNLIEMFKQHLFVN